MSDGVSFQLEGADAVLRRMRALPEKLQKKAALAALRKGAAVVRRAAIANARRFDRSETPNKIYEQVVSRTNPKRGKIAGGVAISIGIKGGAKQYVDNRANRRAGRVGGSYEGAGVNGLYYWRFLEFGTSKMRAQPFLRPALEHNVDAATVAIMVELNAQLDKLTRSL